MRGHAHLSLPAGVALRRGLPPAFRGMKIGLFGGSFDPAHPGHAHVAETAQKRMRLDRVWWLVSPQNPLKPTSGPFEERLRSAVAQARGPRMLVTDLEQKLGCAYTYQTIRALKRCYPGVQFSLIIGADNLVHFRRWRHWREVAQALPIIVVSRPGVGPRWRFAAPRGWTYLEARHHPHSSSALRPKKPPVAKRAPKW